MAKNKNKKTFELTNQQVVDAFAQYLYDTGELGNGEATGELVYELSENNGAKVTVLSMGPPQAKDALREALCMGADEAVLITDRAFAGAVVSKPIAKNTTSLVGLCLAIDTASIGEYNTRKSPPSAFASNKLFLLPGTRIISPKEQTITPCSNKATALSIKFNGVTQTGQPGP